jgi:3-hydroxypropanoate dehydrogenase
MTTLKEHGMSPKAALNRLFLDARTHRHWLDRPVEDDVLRQLYELARMPPTAGNAQPLRLVFVKSAEAKQRLKPALAVGNIDAVMQAPVTAIVAYDLEFLDRMLKPAESDEKSTGSEAKPAGSERKSRAASRSPEQIERLAMQSGTLQGGYLILAARALGLDCGPVGGFDHAKVDAAFMAGTRWKSNFLLNLGFADHDKLEPRRPRLEFEDACRIV